MVSWTYPMNCYIPFLLVMLSCVLKKWMTACVSFNIHFPPVIHTTTAEGIVRQEPSYAVNRWFSNWSVGKWKLDFKESLPVQPLEGRWRINNWTPVSQPLAIVVEKPFIGAVITATHWMSQAACSEAQWCWDGNSGLFWTVLPQRLPLLSPVERSLHCPFGSLYWKADLI